MKTLATHRLLDSSLVVEAGILSRRYCTANCGSAQQLALPFHVTRKRAMLLTLACGSRLQSKSVDDVSAAKMSGFSMAFEFVGQYGPNDTEVAIGHIQQICSSS